MLVTHDDGDDDNDDDDQLIYLDVKKSINVDLKRDSINYLLGETFKPLYLRK